MPLLGMVHQIRLGANIKESLTFIDHPSYVDVGRLTTIMW